MTLLEKAKEMGLRIINSAYGEYADGCPYMNDLESKERSGAFCGKFTDMEVDCVACYAREYIEQKAEAAEEAAPIKDSGERTAFASGAVRDMHEGKGDMASVPWEAILRLSQHYENGAKKYDRWNYRKGIPLSSFIDSACRHLAKYQCGCDDEDHLAAAAFNVLGAMLMENTMPEMIDLPLREGKKTFNYFGGK